MAVPNVPGWQQAILRGIGAPATPENIRYLNAWAQAEGGSASNNPFNTTQPAGGASSYNSVGVRNYTSPQQGIAATVQTLKNGHYGVLLNALRSGRSAMADAQAEAQTPWGTGSLIMKVLGGKVTGGVPTSPSSTPASSPAALAQSMMTGQLPQQGADPLQMLVQLMAANQPQAPSYRYQPI